MSVTEVGQGAGQVVRWDRWDAHLFIGAYSLCGNEHIITLSRPISSL